jgi:hypothetical protein
MRLSDAAAGVFEPEPHATTIAAVALRGDGYHLGVAPCCTTSSPVTATLAQQGSVPTPPVAIDSQPARPYSPWRQLVPRYWTPSLTQGMNPGNPRIGAETGSNDIIGRHAWDLSIAVPTDNSGITGGFAYTYSGLGMPVLDLIASRDWTLAANVYDNTGTRVLGAIRRRVDDGELDATWIHQRYRSSFAVVTGGGVEQYRYVGVPDGTIQLVDTTGVFAARLYPRVLFGLGYARTQAAPFSISPEDGFTLAATARERWRTDIAGSQSLSVVSAATAYKSLDLPGFAHHVLALRGAGGWRDDNATDYLSVGGTSGTPVPIIAGYTVGEGHEDFGVRGFQSGSLAGTRAVAASAEYRLPLIQPGSALGILPLFVERSSLNFFTDYGSAWCGAVTTKLVCTQTIENRFHLTAHRWLGSYGAELNINAAVLSWDAPYRFRFGVAVPYHDEGLLAPASKVSFYFASGLAF